MGVVAPLPPQVRQTQARSQLPLYYGAAAVYCCVVALSIARHEPWADEAQAWLLARDSSLADLWTRLLHYEGTPGVWHTLLHVLIRLGLPYSGLNIVSGVLGLAAAWLVFRYAPLPLAVRLLLPFTFFLAYQYPVVARSYSLAPLLVFGCAVLYQNAVERIGLFTFLLCLLAGLSLHALVLSVSIWLSFYLGVPMGREESRPYRNRAVTGRERSPQSYMIFRGAVRRWHDKRLLTAGAVYVAFVILMIATAWPAKDVAFPYHVGFSFERFSTAAWANFSGAFAGQPIVSLAIVALSIPFLWQGRTLGMFLLSSILLCAASAFVYGNVWHQGFLFLAWLFAVWIAAENLKPTWPILASLSIAIAIQCYWTAASWKYDWQQPYSGSRVAAAYLRNTGIAGQRPFCIGFPCAAVQPYFDRNVFANFDRAYWDWSSQNRADDPTALFSSKAPAFVLLGYETDAERIHWTQVVEMAGYQEIKHFEGNVFWRTRILQPESFDLYRRGTPRPIASTIVMANPTTADQLLSGFYDLENNAWRWTARKFSVALETPPDAAQKGATLLLQLYVPDAQSKKLGPMTLSAQINDAHLAPQTYAGSGRFTYSREVPSSVLQQQMIPVSFSFDKATPPSGAEARELGVVVTSVELTRR